MSKVDDRMRADINVQSLRHSAILLGECARNNDAPGMARHLREIQGYVKSALRYYGTLPVAQVDDGEDVEPFCDMTGPMEGGAR